MSHVVAPQIEKFDVTMCDTGPPDLEDLSLSKPASNTVLQGREVVLNFIPLYAVPGLE